MFNFHINLKISGCIVIGVAGLIVFLSLAINGSGQTPSATPSNISEVTAIYFEPSQNVHSPLIDFAELERQHPLTLAQRLHLTPEDLQHLSQEHLDQLYARLTAGSIPDGSFEGMAFLSPSHVEHLTLVRQVLRKIISSPTNYSQRIQDHWMKLWQGKVFDRRNRMLQNRVNWELVQEIAPLLGQRFEQALHNLPIDTLLFPAKMYCGQSKLDSRRESIILDYAYNDNLSSSCKENTHCETINQLISRKGLNIRDEIRMIHPGLYLGRVYLGKFFLVNFLVMNADLTQVWEQQVKKAEGLSTTHRNFQEDCWTGATYTR